MDQFLAWSLLLAYALYQEAKHRDFTYLPIGIGAIAAIIASAFDQPLWVQMLALVAVLGLSVLAFRKLRFQALTLKPPLGALVTVRNPVDQEHGAVEWNGRVYPARTVQETEHPVGRKLIVSNIEAEMLYVVGEVDKETPAGAAEEAPDLVVKE